MEEVQQSYSEFYQSGQDGAQQDYNTLGSNNYNTVGNGSVAHANAHQNRAYGMSNGSTLGRGGTMGRADVIVDTLGGSSLVYDTVADGDAHEMEVVTTTEHQEGYEEQEQSMRFD